MGRQRLSSLRLLRKAMAEPTDGPDRIGADARSQRVDETFDFSFTPSM